jgi:hypothetical protein
MDANAIESGIVEGNVVLYMSFIEEFNQVTLGSGIEALYSVGVRR